MSARPQHPHLLKYLAKDGILILFVVVLIASLSVKVFSEGGTTNISSPPSPTPTPSHSGDFPSVTPSPTKPALSPTNTASSMSPSPTSYISGSPGSQIYTPHINSPQMNATINNSFTVLLQGLPGSTVDLQLQPSLKNIGAVFLGRASIGGDGKGSYSWNSKNTPNGAYALYATFNHEGYASIIVGPIAVSVLNEITLSSSQLTPTISKTFTSPSLSPSQPLPSKAPLEPVTNTEAIAFPTEVDPKSIPINTATQIAKIENTKTEEEKTVIKLSGKASPNTIITLVIFSNPIVVTVKTDANGFWTYNLEKPLQPGEHAAYVAITKNDGSKVRSEVMQFFIAPAFAATEGESLTLASSTESQPLQDFVFATALVIFGGLLAVAALFVYKKRKEKDIAPHTV